MDQLVDSLNNADSEKQKFKKQIFYLMDRMLDAHYNTFSIDVIMLIVQTLQIIGLLDQAWMNNSTFTAQFQDISQNFLILPYFLNSPSASSQYSILFYLASAFIILVILMFLLVAYLTDDTVIIESLNLKASSKLLYYLLDASWVLTSQVLYIPLMQFFFSIFRCQKNNNQIYSTTAAQDVYFNTVTQQQCFQSSSIPLFILAIISIVLLHQLCSYINGMYYDSRLDCTYKNSRVNGFYEQYVQNFITFFSFLQTLLNEQQYAIIQYAFSFFCWLFFTKTLVFYMTYNYHNFQMCKLQQAFIIFWSTPIALYDHFLPGTMVSVFFWIFGLICLTSYNLFDEPVKNKTCAENSSNYNYVSDALHQLRILCFAIMRYEKYSLKLDGFLNRHRNDCIIPTCPSRSNAIRLKKFNRMLINQTMNEDYVMSIFVIYTVFNNNTLKFRSSNEIRILYALFLLDTVHIKEQSLLQITFLLQNHPSLQQEFSAYRLKRVIESSQNQKDSNNITIEEQSTKFKKQMNAIVQIQMHFWQELLEPKPLAAQLVKKGIQVINLIENLNQIFHQLSSQKRLNTSTVRSFAIFNKNILENQEYVSIMENQMNQNVVQVMDQDEQNNMEEDQFTTGTIVISSQEENFGVIIDANQELSKILGYPITQIMNRNINMLIPNLWQPHHNSFIDQYLTTGKKRFIGILFFLISSFIQQFIQFYKQFYEKRGATRELFIRSKQDYSLPIKINVKTLPSQTLGLLFPAQIYSMNLLYEYPTYFIIQMNGQIDTISPSVIPMFNIELKKIKQGMDIEKIIPNFWIYINEFQQKAGKVMKIKTFQVKMMKESLVKINVQPIKFQNMVIQGYIVSIKYYKADGKSQSSLPSSHVQKKESDMMRTTQQKYQQNKNLRQSNNEQDEEQEHLLSNSELDDLELKENEYNNNKDNNNNHYYNNNYNNNSKSPKKNNQQNIFHDLALSEGKQANQQAKIEKKLEFFFDFRTSTYLGIYVPSQPDDVDTNIPLKQKQKSLFRGMVQTARSDWSQKFLQYQFVYTSERNKDEQLMDILNNAKSIKPKDEKIESEVQKILENLVKKQQELTPKNRGAVSANPSLNNKKPEDEQKNNKMKLLPQVYLKYNELESVQNSLYIYITNAVGEYEEHQYQNKTEMEQSIYSKYNKEYGQNIKTMRLDKNIVKEIKGLNDDEPNSEENLNQMEEQNLEDQNENYEGDYQKEIDESRKNLESFLKDRNFNNNKSLFSIQNLFSFLLFVVEIVFIVLCLISYQTNANNAITRFVMYQQGNLYFANTQGLVGEIYVGIALDKSQYYNVDVMTEEIRQSKFEKVIEHITIYQYGVDGILTTIYLNQVGVTSQMLDLFVQGIHAYVIVHFESSQTFINPQNLYQATQQVLAKAYHLKRLPLGLFIITNSDIGININNFSNQILNKIIEYRDLQHDEIQTFINSTMDSGTWQFIIVGIIISAIIFLILLVFYFQSLYYYYQIPQLLTTIPLSKIRSQIKKGEDFIRRVIILEENEDEQSLETKGNKSAFEQNVEQRETQGENKNSRDQSNIKKNMNESQVNQQNNDYSFNQSHIDNANAKQKAKEASNEENANLEGQISLRGITSQNIRPLIHSLLNVHILFPFLFYLLLFLVYIIVDSQLTFAFTSNLKNFFNEFQYAVQLEPEFQLMSNCLKSSVLSENYLGVRQVYDPLVYFKNNLNGMYTLVDQLLQIHYDNYNNLPSGYQTQFDNYFLTNSNICVELQAKYPSDVNLNECQTFLNGLMKQGMSVNIGHLIRAMMLEAEVIEAGGIQYPYKESVSDTMYEVYIIITYLRVIMRELITLFINGINTLASNLQVIRISVAITISCLIFCNFLFITFPFIQKISNNIFAQRSILNLIPLQIVFQNRHIRQYILKCYLSNSKK